MQSDRPATSLGRVVVGGLYAVTEVGVECSAGAGPVDVHDLATERRLDADTETGGQGRAMGILRVENRSSLSRSISTPNAVPAGTPTVPLIMVIGSVVMSSA